jgi:hypothetical protein
MPVARRTLPTLAAVAALAVPGAARAADVQFDRSCYAPGDAVTETGSGFTPGADVLEMLSLTSLKLAPQGNFQAPMVTTDDQGAFTRKLRAPALGTQSDRQEIAMSSFTDQANPSAPVFGQWTLSAWDVSIKEWAGHAAHPGRSMTVDTYGWTTASGTLYAHYYRGTTFLKSTRIGATTGPCGDLRKKMPQFPFKRVKAGRYTVFFSPTQVLDKQHDAWLKTTVTVPRSAATS